MQIFWVNILQQKKKTLYNNINKPILFHIVSTLPCERYAIIIS